MIDIKVKEKSNIKIKKLDKSKIYSQKLKENIINVKEKKSNGEEDTPTEYASNQVTNKSKIIMNKGINKLNDYGEELAKETKDNIQKVSQKIKKKMQIKNIKRSKKDIKAITRKNNQRMTTLSENIKIINLRKPKKITRNTPKTTENIKRNTKQLLEETSKGLKRAYQITKTTAKKSVTTIKAGVKKTMSAIRAIIASTKALILALIAGGWIAMIMIVVICFIALICSSALGIFFSNEKSVNSRTMSSVMTEINTEFASKLAEIQNTTEHDDFEINSNRAKWKDVLSIYAVLVTGGNDQSDVILLDDKKIERLKSVFWEMNIISSRVENIEKDIETFDEEGNVVIQKVARRVLFIDITSKSIEEMIQQYHFNKNQLEQLTELQKEEYNSLWANVLSGSFAGSTDIVEVAFSQIGNVGGEPFWRWYGYSSRVEWCACFVSWCAEQCGYINSGVIPKFSACQNEGVVWFKTCGLWQDRGYVPKAGDIIFFDWEVDGHSDHVGIVERCENGKVYTIEGNTTGDMCKQNVYDVVSNIIMGYGTPMY